MQYRSGHEARELDVWPTLPQTIRPLLPYLPSGTRFVEPAAGDYRLAAFLEGNGHECVFASDIEPRHDEVCKRDAATHDFRNYQADMIITNLPYRRDMLQPILKNLIGQLPIWMVIYSGWLDTEWAKPFMEYASHELPIGRAPWEIPGKPEGGGKRDFSWVRFGIEPVPTIRLPKGKCE